jgi:hypothetical protein
VAINVADQKFRIYPRFGFSKIESGWCKLIIANAKGFGPNGGATYKLGPDEVI